MTSLTSKKVAIVGTGPAGLMAAHVITSSGANAGMRVTLFEKKSGPGRKFLVAGSSGLNISYDAPHAEMLAQYRGPRERFETFLKEFPRESWLEFVHALGIKTFKGTSRRYFVEGMKASTPLKAWLDDLRRLGAELKLRKELTEITSGAGGVTLQFADGTEWTGNAALLCLGGGSWEKRENPLRWPAILKKHGIALKPFEPSNCGWETGWSREFLKEAEGKPLKNVVLKSSLGEKRGELVITRYGLEGTPIYTLGTQGPATLDLLPELSEAQALRKLKSGKENLSPIRRAKKFLPLTPAAHALLFHHAPKEALATTETLAKILKAFPLTLDRPRPLSEAISSSGGVRWDELTDALMLKKLPGVYAAGEMLDWDAPTGGFLIQGCVSMGHYAGNAILKALRKRR